MSAPSDDTTALERARLFDRLADTFTLYERAFTASLPGCDADCAPRIARVLARFAAATHYDARGALVANPAPGSSETVWDDPEDAAVAFVMAANWEAVASDEPTLIDYFALREGPAFVVDALMRTWGYHFEASFDGHSRWLIRRVPPGVEGAGTLRANAWQHLRARRRAAPAEARSLWSVPAARRAALPVLARCTVAWLEDERGAAEVTAARAVLEAAPAVARGMALEPLGPNTSDLADWVLRDLRPNTQQWGRDTVAWALDVLASERDASVALLGRAARDLVGDPALEWLAGWMATALAAIGTDAARAELAALAAAPSGSALRAHVAKLARPPRAKTGAKTSAKKRAKTSAKKGAEKRRGVAAGRRSTR